MGLINDEIINHFAQVYAKIDMIVKRYNQLEKELIKKNKIHYYESNRICGYTHHECIVNVDARDIVITIHYDYGCYPDNYNDTTDVYLYFDEIFYEQDDLDIVLEKKIYAEFRARKLI